MTHENDHIDIEFQPEPDRLYAHNRRQLSAMLDGELSPDQARFMLRRLQHDVELAACWERWQVCGDVLRGQGHALLPADFSRRVAAAIGAQDGAGAATDAHAARPERAPVPGRHRLLRWGGGALAASVALLAVFMARQVPDARPAQLAAVDEGRPAEALVEPARPLVAADPAGIRAGADAPAAAPAVPGPDEGGNAGGAALLAGAAPVVVAAAEVPRRSGERASTRSQSQRAALRRSQAGGAAPVVAVASAPRPVATPSAVDTMAAGSGTVLPVLAGVPAAATPEGEALFGGPAAATRPWPRAVLPGLSRPSYAVGHGLPQPEVFAPFHPRLDEPRQQPPRRFQPQPALPAVPGPGAAAERPAGAR